jgi:hypothetical protein
MADPVWTKVNTDLSLFTTEDKPDDNFSHGKLTLLNVHIPIVGTIDATLNINHQKDQRIFNVLVGKKGIQCKFETDDETLTLIDCMTNHQRVMCTDATDASTCQPCEWATPGTECTVPSLPPGGVPG